MSIWKRKSDNSIPNDVKKDDAGVEAKPAASAEPSGPMKARPIFISSTFKDMHAERGYLVSHVFPRLEEELRKRRHQLEPIDLRLGVETAQIGTEEARELLVLKVCLEEIQRSRPFMLVLLGDRYGWVPPPERMAAAAREAGFQADLRDKSVTALEIEFGVLKEYPEQRRRSFFYFRKPLPYDKMPPVIAARYSDAYALDPLERAGHDRLNVLKDRLRKDPELGPRVHDYEAGWDEAANRVTNLPAWGEMVYQHLWRELDEETRIDAGQLPPPTREAREQAALAEFVELRRRDFTGRRDLLRHLHDLAVGPDVNGAACGACLVGSPGSGKSAVFAELYQRIASESSVLVLTNAAGSTPLGSQVDFMLRRFIQELAEFLKEAHPLPEKAGPDDVDAAFAALLVRAAAKTRVVVLLDALDQFDSTPRGQYLTWLRTRQWPANARLVATSLPGTGAEVLARWAGIENLEIPPLGPDDIAEIARRIWARYHRQANPDVVSVLTEKARPDGGLAASNPLWLTLAVEQLNLLDADDFARAERDYSDLPPAERLRALVIDTARRLPATVADLYSWLLEWTEVAYGAPQARAFAALIAVSRFGWRESDLLALVPRAASILFPVSSASSPGGAGAPLEDLGLATLRRGFRAHLGRRGEGGYLDFLHAQMRQAVRDPTLSDPEIVHKIHCAIADHLEGLTPDDTLCASELMVHLIEGDDSPRAARLYAELESFSPGLTGATQALTRHVAQGAAGRPNLSADWISALLTQPGLAGQQLSILCHRFNFELNDALENTADIPTRKLLLLASRRSLQQLALSNPDNAGWQRDLAVSHNKIGDVLSALGDLAGALSAYRESLAVLEKLADSHPGSEDLLRDLSVSRDRIGDVLLAQGDPGGALLAYREALAVLERLAESDPDNTDRQRDITVSRERIGNVMFMQSDLGGALQAYREAQSVRERLAKSDPDNMVLQRDLATIQDRIGDVLVARGDLVGASLAFREALALSERLALSDPANGSLQSDLSLSQNKIGDVLRAKGDLAGAFTAYRESLAVRERLALSDPSNGGWQHDLSTSHHKIGEVLLARGELLGSLDAFRQSLSLAERLASSDPSNADWQRDLAGTRDRIGDVLSSQGDLGGALQAYRESRALIERLALSDPGNAVWQRDLFVSLNKYGDVLGARGDLDGALKAYRESLSIIERLALSDPSNVDRQRDLSVNQQKIGDVLSARGDLGGALRAYLESSAVLERLVVSDPSHAGRQGDLASCRDRIGDVLSDQGNLGGALKLYRDSLAVRERLALLDPSNGGWQRVLSVSHNKIGDVLRDQGDLGGALKAYRECLKIRERLVLMDTTNAGWQRDLAASRDRNGDVLAALGNLGDALKLYRESLVVRERLALLDATNAGWQRDLATSRDRIGNILSALRDLGGALQAYRESAAVYERLAISDSGNSVWLREQSVGQEKIGSVLMAQGDLSGALKAYRASMAIIERLALSDPSNAGWQRDLSVNRIKIGDALMAQGDRGGALKAYRESLAARERLALSDPSNAGWQRDLVVAYWKMAEISDQTGSADVQVWWRKAYDQLASMKRRGTMLPTDEEYLAVLKEKTGLG